MLWAQLDAFSSRKLSSLNDIPASFLKNPQTNFAAYAEKAKVRASTEKQRDETTFTLFSFFMMIFFFFFSLSFFFPFF